MKKRRESGLNNLRRIALLSSSKALARSRYFSHFSTESSQARGKRGTDVGPDFNWNKPTVPMMGYR